MADTADLDAQIAALQALKASRVAAAEEKERRAQKERASVLVESTPTKKRVENVPPPSPPKQPSFRAGFTSAKNLLRKAAPEVSEKKLPPQPARASSLAANLAKRRGGPAARAELPSIPRSSGFGDKSAMNKAASGSGVSRTSVFLSAKGKEKATDIDDELEIVRDGTERDADLTLLNNLPLGPGEFGTDPEGGEEWRSLEPNSGIRLSKRVLPHADVQDHLYGRFHLRPQQIYSVARLSRDGSTYDIPVEGDWVTIAVVAERSDIRVSGMRAAASDDEDDEDDDAAGNTSGKKAKGDSTTRKKNNPKERKRQPRKYINLKLVALPPRSATLGKDSSASGDALLQLLLFESDSIVRLDDGEGGVKRSYRGGSGGAYEKWCNLAVGSVIAILNPRVLRPISRNGGGPPHPLTLPLALNPQSDNSIQLIGHAMDLGRCSSIQRDGNRCKTWVDLRLNGVCEYHIHLAVKRGRSSRAEFASATTPFVQTQSRGRFGSSSARGGSGGAAHDDYDTYDPRQKRGLLPRNGARAAPRGSANGGGGVTYVVGSGIARTGKNDAMSAFGDSHLAERMGRNQARQRKRKIEEAETEASLNKMFEKMDDSGVGAQYLTAAGKGPPKKEEPPLKRVFHPDAIKLIGFDPSGLSFENPKEKLDSIDMFRKVANQPRVQSRRSGPKRLSNVVVPPSAAPTTTKPPADEMIDLD